MKKQIKIINLMIAYVLFIPCLSRAQEYGATKSIQVYVTRLNVASDQLQKFIHAHRTTILRTELTSDKYSSQFSIGISHIHELDSLANSMGYVTYNRFNTDNLNEKIALLEEKVNGLEEENNSNLMELSDSMFDKNRAESLRRAISANQKMVREHRQQISKYRKSLEDETCRVDFTINDEMSTPNNSRVSFVNMPGVEYAYLKIENPKTGVSTGAYQGFAVKYMFTRGKSFLNLGVYRAVDNQASDSTLINELFMINFGQDFYPRNFGRGKRKYLNLYTGYQIGGFIVNRNNEKNGSFIPNFNMSLGLELLKTKHVLIDNKVSYFLPLDDYNRNLRGLLYQASFNFVF